MARKQATRKAGGKGVYIVGSHGTMNPVAPLSSSIELGKKTIKTAKIANIAKTAKTGYTRISNGPLEGLAVLPDTCTATDISPDEFDTMVGEYARIVFESGNWSDTTRAEFKDLYTQMFRFASVHRNDKLANLYLVAFVALFHATFELDYLSTVSADTANIKIRSHDGRKDLDVFVEFIKNTRSTIETLLGVALPYSRQSDADITCTPYEVLTMWSLANTCVSKIAKVLQGY